MQAEPEPGHDEHLGDGLRDVGDFNELDLQQQV
jgi:hypothetical protein